MKHKKTVDPKGEMQDASQNKSICAGEVMPVGEAMRRLGWARKTLYHARREGLRTVKFGRRVFIRGDDVIEFFTNLATREPEA